MMNDRFLSLNDKDKSMLLLDQHCDENKTQFKLDYKLRNK